MIGIDGRFDLDGYLEGERIRVQEALVRAIERFRSLVPDALLGPIEVGVGGSGKRLRPILCTAAYRACRQAAGSPASVDDDALYDLAVSLEVIHAYSLMHDDLPCMDDAPLRRGKATPHTIFGEERTLLAGALLIPLAARQLWDSGDGLLLDDEARRDLVLILARGAGAEGMVGGQGLDLLGEGELLSRDRLDELHRRKTGALLTASLLLGGRAARAAPAAMEALDSYGREVGLAFQIADDILDATSEAEALGKHPSDDALEKSTYVRLLGVEGARREAEERIHSALRALDAVGMRTPPLEALAWYVVGRDR